MELAIVLNAIVHVEHYLAVGTVYSNGWVT